MKLLAGPLSPATHSWSVPSPMSQPCHALAEPGGCRRSQEDTKKIQLDYRRSLADTQDTRGHGITPVRDREAPGSNPGPPTSFLSSEASSGALRLRLGHSRVTDLLNLGPSAALTPQGRWTSSLNLSSGPSSVSKPMGV